MTAAGVPARFDHGRIALGARGLSYELNASPGKLISGRDVAMAYPDIQVILGHAGFPVQRDAEYFELWKREMSALGEAENVACKISGFGMADNHWTIDSIRPWVLHCIEAFGVDRCMFESNFPPDKQSCGYTELWNAFKHLTKNASAAEKTALYSATAARVYKLMKP